MLFFIFTEHQDIIQIDDYNGVQFLFEHVVQEAHEGRGSIGQTEGKNEELVEAITSAEGGLVDIVIMDLDLVVSGAEVDFAEDLGIVETVKQLIDSWQWVCILDCLFIEGTIINAHAKITFLFANKQNGGFIRRLAWADETMKKEII